MTKRVPCLIAFSLSFALAAPLSAQVQTEVPAPVPGAPPVTVEHIKVHGAALESNLEGDAVDRDVIVFLPPATTATSIVAIRSSTHCTDIPSEPNNGRTRSMCRKPSKAHSPRARKR